MNDMKFFTHLSCSQQHSQAVVKSAPSEDDSETLTNTTETHALPVLESSLADGAEPKDADLDEPVAKKNKCALDELFGDVFVTSVEPPKSIYDRLEVEVQIYKAEAVHSIDSSPLQWWRLREEKYPLLSKLARESLCVPATSVASERVFSTAGDIVNSQQASLSSENVDTLICLKTNTG